MDYEFSKKKLRYMTSGLSRGWNDLIYTLENFNVEKYAGRN
jgi:hypothetical protein